MKTFFLSSRCPNPFPTIGSTAVLSSSLVSSTDYQQRPKSVKQSPGNWREIALLCTTVVVPSSWDHKYDFSLPLIRTSESVRRVWHLAPPIPYNGIAPCMSVYRMMDATRNYHSTSEKMEDGFADQGRTLPWSPFSELYTWGTLPPKAKVRNPRVHPTTTLVRGTGAPIASVSPGMRRGCHGHALHDLRSGVDGRQKPLTQPRCAHSTCRRLVAVSSPTNCTSVFQRYPKAIWTGLLASLKSRTGVSGR